MLTYYLNLPSPSQDYFLTLVYQSFIDEKINFLLSEWN